MAKHTPFPDGVRENIRAVSGVGLHEVCYQHDAGIWMGNEYIAYVYVGDLSMFPGAGTGIMLTVSLMSGVLFISFREMEY